MTSSVTVRPFHGLVTNRNPCWPHPFARRAGKPAKDSRVQDQDRTRTESVEAANAPAPSLALLRVAIEAVVDAVVVTSPELDPPGPVIEYVNPAFSAISGYPADEAVGRSPRFLQGPRTDRAALDKLRAELAAGGPAEGEAINYRKDGSEYVVEWLITAVRDEQGRVRHWVAAQRDVTERHRAQARQAVLMAELQHRTRNLLAVVGAIADRTFSRNPALAEYGARLAALGRVQSLLSGKTQDWSVPVAEVVRAELDAHGAGPGGQIQVGGPAIELSGDQVQAVALALHELATNAVKHGALAQASGRLSVTWQVEGGGDDARLVIDWRESGVSMPGGPPAHRGYGTGLITVALPYQLDAETALEFAPDGVRCRIALPLGTFRDEAVADKMGGT